MFKEKIFGTIISININEPGLYICEYLSSTGKSYLAEYLNELHGMGFKVGSYRFDTKFNDNEYNKLLDSNCNIIMLDRLDMYNKFINVDKLRDICNNKIVLADYKRYKKLIPNQGMCEIDLNSDSIEVNLA